MTETHTLPWRHQITSSNLCCCYLYVSNKKWCLWNDICQSFVICVCYVFVIWLENEAVLVVNERANIDENNANKVKSGSIDGQKPDNLFL